MKLNNKGYLLVEIIVAFTIAMTMAYFLIEIVIDIKNINEDYYVDTKLETDQILITKNVMQDISNYTLKEIKVKNQKQIDFTFYNLDNTTFKTRLNLDIDNKKFQYGRLNGNNYIKNTLFTKTLDSKLNYETPTISKLCLKDNNYEDCDTLSDINDITDFMLSIKYKATTIYSDKDYGININIPYKKEKEIEIKIYNPCTKDPLTINCTNGAICETTNDNRIVKIISSGDVELEPGYGCKEKELGIALVGGGDGGKTGQNARQRGNDSATTTVGGEGGNGGSGGKIIINKEYNLNLEKYKITIGEGGTADSIGKDTIINKNDDSTLLSSTTGTNIEGGLGGISNIDCARIGNENTVLCNFFTRTSQEGTNGPEIIFNSINVGIYGSSGGGGGSGNKANSSQDERSKGAAGGINAGTGGTGGLNRNDYGGVFFPSSGENGKENTGSGGGGGAGGAGYQNTQTPSNYQGSPGGIGGSGVIILYNELGFNVNSGTDTDYAMNQISDIVKTDSIIRDIYRCRDWHSTCIKEINSYSLNDNNNIKQLEKIKKDYHLDKVYLAKLIDSKINTDFIIDLDNDTNTFIEDYNKNKNNTNILEFKYKTINTWDGDYLLIVKIQ